MDISCVHAMRLWMLREDKCLLSPAQERLQAKEKTRLTRPSNHRGIHGRPFSGSDRSSVDIFHGNGCTGAAAWIRISRTKRTMTLSSSHSDTPRLYGRGVKEQQRYQARWLTVITAARPPFLFPDPRVKRELAPVIPPIPRVIKY